MTDKKKKKLVWPKRTAEWHSIILAREDPTETKNEVNGPRKYPDQNEGIGEHRGKAVSLSRTKRSSTEDHFVHQTRKLFT
jgi:hypothetical protein